MDNAVFIREVTARLYADRMVRRGQAERYRVKPHLSRGQMMGYLIQLYSKGNSTVVTEDMLCS